VSSSSGNTTSDQFSILSLADLRNGIDQNSAMPVAIAHKNDSLLTVLYTPKDIDSQQPHDQDEIYVVATGSATLEVEHNRRPLRQGDAAFVQAKAQHRFVEFSDDFAVWAIFPVKP